MKTPPYRSAAIACALSLISFAVPRAYAGIISGVIWQGEQAVASNLALIGQLPSTPDATFSVDAIDFTSSGNGKSGNNGNNYTPSLFLSSNSGDDFSGFSNKEPGFSQNGSLNNSVIELTGTLSLTTNEPLSLLHDDGAVLTLTGLDNNNPIINSPNLTQAVTSSYLYTGAPASYNFTLYYGEANGAPADLVLSLQPSTVVAPEPSTIALFGAGVLAIAIGSFRQSRPARRS